MKKTISVLAAALAMSTAVQAAGLEGVDGYAMIGQSDISGLDSGLAFKVGGDFNKNLGGVKGLGLTGFFSYWGGDNEAADVTGMTFAAGPTFDLPLPNTKFTLQGRAFLAYSRVKVEGKEVCQTFLGQTFCAGGGSSTDSEIDLGFGFGGSYKIDDRMSFRVDYDMIEAGDGDADVLTFGVGYKF